MVNKPLETDSEGAGASDAAHPDRLVERMFSGFGHAPELPAAHPMRPLERAYYPLRHSRALPGATYRLQPPSGVGRVQADSPAIDVMTDLSRVAPVTTRPHASVAEARQTMIAHGVRLLFVVEGEAIAGVITSTDIFGEKPVLIAQQRSVRHDEVPVRELMTLAGALEAMDVEEVQRARVGDIVASLRLSGRQHALVIAGEPAGGSRIVRGIFSLTQIARQLGLPPHISHDVARTFAEIEAVIGA